MLYGLSIRSEIALPNATICPIPPSEADVSIRVGWTPDLPSAPQSSEAYVQFQSGAVLFVVPNVARYLISGGTQIVVQPAAGANQDILLVYLLGTACGLLLHQRGSTVLHAGAIETSHGAVAFVGRSGIGKSTLLAALQHRGYRVLADDVCAISRDAEGRPHLYPGPAHLKLWRDAATMLGYDVAPLRRTDLWRDKYLLPLAAGSTQSVPLHAIYAPSISQEQAVRVETLPYRQRVQVVLQHTYRNYCLNEMGLAADHFVRSAALARETPIEILHRPQDLDQLPRLLQVVEEELARPLLNAATHEGTAACHANTR